MHLGFWIVTLATINAGRSFPTTSLPPTTAVIASARLVGGVTSNQGRVEVYYNGRWGTVCDDAWSLTDSDVVCRQLGYSGAQAYRRSAYYGQGSGQIWMDDVSCLGYEAALSLCLFSGWGIHNCDHSEDVGVVCTPLSNATSVTSWPTTKAPTTDSWWTSFWPTTQTPTTDFWWFWSTTQAPTTDFWWFWSTTQAPTTDFWWITRVPPFNFWTPTQSPALMGPAKIRLAGGYSSYEGRVEIFYGGVWGTVCDDLWGDSDSQVVCRQLGFSHALSYRTKAFYGQGLGPVWMDSVSCNGYEQALSSCYFSGWGVTDCSHGEDVGVVCSGIASTSRNGDIRLAGGSNVKEGRVEIFQNGIWGSVCDRGFTDTDAKVVCRQLGYSTSSAKAHTNAYYGRGSGTFWLDAVDCDGDELRLVSCYSTSVGIKACNGHEAGVDCNSPDTSPTTAVAASVSGIVTFIIVIAIIVVIARYRYRSSRRTATSSSTTATEAVEFVNQEEPSIAVPGYRNPLYSPNPFNSTANNYPQPQKGPMYPLPQAGAMYFPPQAEAMNLPTQTGNMHLWPQCPPSQTNYKYPPPYSNP